MRKLRYILLLALVFLFLPGSINAFAEDAAALEKKQVTISFNTAGGSACEPILGYAGETAITKEMLPTPTKNGYTFKGWHHFNEDGAPFELTVFPNFDITLFANFEPNGFTVNFEGSVNPTYDISSGIELYGVKSEGYSDKMIRSGWNSLRTIEGKDYPMFLLSYQNKLEVGKEYELKVWLYGERDRIKGDVDFIYVENPDVREKPLGYHKAFEIDNLKKETWTEYKVKFVAAAPYMIIRLPDEVGLYIEDVEVESTGKTGEIPKLKEVKGKNPISKKTFLIIALLSAVATVIIMPRMKNKRKVWMLK